MVKLARPLHILVASALLIQRAAAQTIDASGHAVIVDGDTSKIGPR